VVLTDTVQKLGEAQKRSDEARKQADEAQKQADERMSALIAIVDELIRKRPSA
jgi:hypothetical protein